jgi:uncharacterized protein (DUF1778 family)
LWCFGGYYGDMAGRPKKAQGGARGNVLRIRLTADERRLLDRAASSRSLETSSWARSELVMLAKKLLGRKG